MYNLPVSHPQYRYPDSLNPYWKKLNEFEGRIFSDHAAEQHLGKWAQLHPNQDAKIHLEIGCNAGHVTLEWAKRDPGSLYLGMDWKFKAIYRAAEKAKKRNLENLRWIRGHAERLSFLFGPGELDSISVFFPDPWPKKGHWKHRWIKSESLLEMRRLLKKDGVLHIKTDHPGYFEWILTALEGQNEEWQVTELTRDLHANHPNPTLLSIPEITLFEGLFIKDQIPIHSLKLTPR